MDNSQSVRGNWKEKFDLLEQFIESARQIPDGADKNYGGEVDENGNWKPKGWIEIKKPKSSRGNNVSDAN